MRDRITISLYSREQNNVAGYSDAFLNEITNIQKIYNGLVNAAKDTGRESPEFIISVLLVPDWTRNGNAYDNPEYLIKKNAFLTQANGVYGVLQNVTVTDFSVEPHSIPSLSKYMHPLKAMGSNADLIKTVALINNMKRRHLQIDSNTIVHSFKELYNNTFNAAEQRDGINASYYDPKYVTAHNKMVYTTPTGGLAQSGDLLKDLLQWWCAAHRNDDNQNGDKRSDKNSIYSKVFTRALCSVGYVEKFECSSDGNQERIIYPATLSDKVYWLTDYMSTALNMSWSVNEITLSEKLKNLPSCDVGDDGKFNYQCLLNVIKKHTGDLSLHSQALQLQDESDTGELSRERLLHVSNVKLEIKAARDFCRAAMHHTPHLAEKIAKLFPDTRLVDDLSRLLFNRTVKELQREAHSAAHSAPAINQLVGNAPASSSSSATNNSKSASEEEHINYAGPRK
ncbi:MAG: hypothetical protein P4M12_07100 [Gammaproteobacteria bacterium]|nr:hypothetical protein [Gammaproteobacteria bacterium]